MKKVIVVSAVVAACIIAVLFARKPHPPGTADRSAQRAQSVPNGPAQPRSVATDAIITVDASPLLAPASWSAAGLVTEVNTPTLLRIRDGMPVDSAPQRFLQLRVQINPP